MKRKALVWWTDYQRGIRTAPAEFVLAVVMTLWAVILWLPQDSFVPDAVFASVERALGGESSMAAVCSVLAFLQWCGLFIDGWSPKFRALVMFAQIGWWTFVTIESAWTRWYSPVWCTTLGLVGLSVLVWLRIQAEITRAEFSLRVRRASGDADGGLG
jgi:hypothetical protein